MHKDTEFDLRPCERPENSGLVRIRDLTQNYQFAETAIAVAHRFFQFDFEKVYFSGYAKEDEDGWESSKPLRVEVWYEAKPHCKVDFLHSNVQGVLYVEFKHHGRPETAFGMDIVGAIQAAVNKEHNLSEKIARVNFATVDVGNLTVNIDLFPR